MALTDIQTIGLHLGEFLHSHDEENIILKTLLTGEELYNASPLGTEHRMSFTKILRDSNQNTIGVIGVFQSFKHIIDVRKKESASQLAAGKVHEISNPPTVFGEFLRFLQTNQLDDESIQSIDSLLISKLDRANNSLADFLQMSKPLKSNIETFRVGDFVQYLKPILLSESVLYNVEMSYTTSMDAEAAYVQGSQDELVQVFINLFKNAIEANQHRGFIINLNLALFDNWLLITFFDNGCGIKESDLQKVFNPLFTTKTDGTGLGLAVSKKIIESHQGSINVRSNKVGTTFTIFLPTVSR